MLKSFALEKVFVIRKLWRKYENVLITKKTNYDYVTLLIDQINFLKEQNKTKNTIIQVLSENQSYFSKQ